MNRREAIIKTMGAGVGLAVVGLEAARRAAPANADEAHPDWGPAGIAPQSVEDAQNILKTNRSDLLTEQFGFGNNPIVGWTVGTAGTQKQEIRVTIGNLPAGTVVHFDPGSSSITGQHIILRDEPKSKSVQMLEPGSAEGLKYTVYWTR